MKLAQFLLPAVFGCSAAIASELRVGIIGCDTSHVPEFTELLNNPQAKGHVAGAKVIAAFKGGSKDIESSWSRVDRYAKTLQEKHAVRFYDNIEDMCRDVDAVLLESLDGRPHLEQARPVIKAHKPLFIDTPMAGSLHDVIEIFREDKSFHGLARGEKGEVPAGAFEGYEPLVVEIIKFFQTGVAPVSPEETIQIFAFMEAADESKRQEGRPVKISDVLKKNGQ